MRGAFALVDEVWCASDFVREALEVCADRPVVKHPLALTPTVATSMSREDLGLPLDRFLFGFVFDYASVFERKNPDGLVEAYRRGVRSRRRRRAGPEDDSRRALARSGRRASARPPQAATTS